MMSLRPVYGHAVLRHRLAAAFRTERLPASLLFVGPRGVGKQRLALWLGQLLLCNGSGAQGRSAAARSTAARRADHRRTSEHDGLDLLGSSDVPASDPNEPCGQCQQCRYTMRLQHPDLHWFFPREKKAGKDPSNEEVRAELAEIAADRVAANGLWAASSGMEGLHIASVRALIQAAGMRPAMAARSVFVVGDAERMVSQEGSDQAANAFLKLLEEPPNGTTLILTTSEPGALLPTIRSRVVTVRVAPLPPPDVAAFIADPAVRDSLGADAGDLESLISRATGAPGQLLGSSAGADAHDAARRLLDAALAPRTPDGDAMRAEVAAASGVTKARGAYSDALDALTVLLHARIRGALDRGLDRHARHVALAIGALERAKPHTQRNITPQLLTAVLLDELAELLARPAT